MENIIGFALFLAVVGGIIALKLFGKKPKTKKSERNEDGPLPGLNNRPGDGDVQYSLKDQKEHRANIAGGGTGSD